MSEGDPEENLTGRTATAETCLAVYGTLAPGQPNHHQLSALEGVWSEGQVRGKLLQAGWGAAVGFPGLILDPEGEVVRVDIFQSPDLPDHWDRLDVFEGREYKRVETRVVTKQGAVPAYIYVVRSMD